ncbi:hypothetical protein GO755_25925 [Spirosoma sp. HMF4905]|uniref:Uncharacterized protein n=1 Tax=Spirosoma arboris TaxID=2682092 RepID=A0A7K1SI73_9BACT|nr:hypothetical protein [Spirosoma arboris]MVM33502.1 hypothetical protein [Spirosoma arboris]
MAERVQNGYRRLFELRLFHHYWLDQGSILFDLLTKQQQEDRLLTYDLRQFLAIAPTSPTEKLLKKLGAIYKNTALGCVVVVPAGTVVPADTLLELVLTVQNTDFFTYTALTLPKQTITEYVNRRENTMYRYKQGVAVLSNLTGTARTIDGVKSLYLSKEIPKLTDSDQAKVESLVLDNTALLQLTGDQPGALTQELGSQAQNLPVFVHQEDIPVIAPLPDLVDFPEAGLRGVQLSDAIPDTVYALVRIAVERPDDADFSCVTDGATPGIPRGLPKAIPPVFQIHLKNRSTFRAYYDKLTGNLLSKEPTPLPLTWFSPDRQVSREESMKPRPSTDSITIAFDPVDPQRITGLFSTITK